MYSDTTGLRRRHIHNEADHPSPLDRLRELDAFPKTYDECEQHTVSGGSGKFIFACTFVFII